MKTNTYQPSLAGIYTYQLWAADAQTIQQNSNLAQKSFQEAKASIHPRSPTKWMQRRRTLTTVSKVVQKEFMWLKGAFKLKEGKVQGARSRKKFTEGQTLMKV